MNKDLASVFPIPGLNDNIMLYPADKTITDLFALQVAATPDAVALIYDHQQLTYRELDERSGQLAHYLLSKGTGPETLVPLCIERCPEMIIGIMGILKAGCAYVPVDPAYPQDRIDYMLQDTGASLVVSSSTCSAKLSADGHRTIIALDTDWPLIAAMPLSVPPVFITPRHLAYVIYTSGSTGRPKGVLIEHGGVVNFVYGQITPLGLRPGICVFQFSSLSFDASVYEIFCALLQGGKLVLAKREALLDKEQFCGLLTQHQVELILLPPSFQPAITDNACHLKTVISGGEAINTTYAAQLLQQGVKVVNAYGPTEITVCATVSENPLLENGIVTIGRPNGNIQVYLLDEERNAVPAGTAGEIYISGPGLARGYLNRPDLTAERFVHNPFADVPDSRMYRSGDLGRYLPDGNIEYLGRIDDQVKIRGYRIELGEIEQVLLQSGKVERAVVLARQEINGNKRLVSYIIPAGAFDRQSILAFISSRLPEYMVPAVIVPMDTLPLTPNGKVDKKALLEIDLSADTVRTYAMPRNETEQQLATIWQELLQVRQAGIHDNFYELGGDSIIAIQVASRAKRLGYNLRTGDIYARPTIAQLSVFLLEQQPAVQITAGEQGLLSGSCGLLPIQQWYFGGDSFLQSNYRYFNQSICTGIDKSVTREELLQVVQELLRYHDALRFVYRYNNGNWSQEYGSYTGVVNTVEMGVLAVQSDCYQRRLMIEKGELVRVVLMYTPATERYNRLLIIVHHLAIDGVSWRILLEDTGALLSAIRRGEPVSLGQKGTSYRQWYEALTEYGNSPALLSQLPFWENIIRVQAPLPTDYDYDGALASGDIAKTIMRLPVVQTRQLLQEVPRVYHTEVNDMLLAALAKACCNSSGSNQLLIGLEGHGREDIVPGIDLARTTGWFTNLYPVLLTLTPDESAGALLLHVKEQLRNIPDKGMGYGVLKYTRGEESLQGKDPWQVVFNYLGQMDNMTRGNEWLNQEDPSMASIGEDYIEREKLALNSWVQQGELVLEWSYSKKHYNENTVTALAASYLQELQLLITHCITQQSATYQSWDDNITAIYPLTPLQEGMLFHGLYNDHAGAYLEQTMATLELAQPDLFCKAWEHLIQRYTILRSGFYHNYTEVPVQGVHRTVQLPVTIQDCRHLTAEAQSARITACRQSEKEKGFDFRQPPLMRLALLQLGESEYHLIWTYHHILLDGWSIPVLLEELVRTYEELSAGKMVAYTTDHFEDYIQYIEKRNREEEEVYWKGYMSGVTGSTLLPFISRSGESTKGIGDYREEWWHLGDVLTARITSFVRQHRLTVNTLIQGIWAYLLHRYTGNDRIVYGVTVSGRPEDMPGIEQRVGMYINTLPLHSVLQEDTAIVEWLQALQQHQQQSREYQYTALSDIQQWNRLKGDLFDTLIAFANYPSSGNQDAGLQQLKIRDLHVAEHTNYPFSLLIETSPQLSILFSYNASLLEPAYAQRIRGHFEQVLEQLLQAAPGEKAGGIVLTSAAERRELISVFNDTAVGIPASATITRLFDQHVQQTPEAVAVVFENTRLTYRELDERAAQLGRYLRGKGVCTDTLVPLCTDRGPEMIIGILGILKAGGAYVPVDPAYPQDRIDYMLQDTAATIAVTTGGCREKLATGGDFYIIELDTDWPEIADYTGDDTDEAPRPSDLAYVIYTSGSTGRPKGVMITHQGVANLVHAQQGPLRLRPGIPVFQFSSFSFDASCYEIFLTLLHGGKLVMARREVLLDASALCTLLDEHRVALITLPPSYQSVIADNVYHLETVVSAGEMLNTTYALRIQEQGVTVINAYGPTENTVCATLSESPIREDGIVTIGTPNVNVQIYILDVSGNPQPVGVPGEMYIGGAQVARGYLHRPELTQERFVPDVFRHEGQLYRTGDLARWLPDGNIEYLGRIDDQVKIRGYRIEPGEIENVLQQCPYVQQAVVLARAGADNISYLAGYIVPEGTFDRGTIITWLKGRLPEYMVPAVWVPVTAFALTPNGKIDKKALPEPDIAGLQSRAYVAPRNQHEEQLAQVWKTLLHLPKPGIHDAFFEMGGNSLLAMRVIAAVRKTWDIELTIKELFDHTTIATLAAHIAGRKNDHVLPPLLPVSGDIPVPLSFSQERLWFIDQLQGSVAYHIPLGLQLAAATDADMLEQSLRTIVQRHTILRTVIRATDHAALQEVMPADGWALQRITEASGVSFNDIIAVPFDLSKDYMLRAVLISRREQSPWLLLVVHHIAADGWSMSVLLNELQQEYTALQENRPGLPVTLPLQYADYAVWQRQLEATVMTEKLAYWKTQLKGLLPLQLPTDYVRPAVQNTQGGTVKMEIDRETSGRIASLCQEEGVTLFMALLAAFKVLLYRYTHQQDICVGVPVAGRTHQEVETLIGFFVNMLPLRSTLDGNTRFTDLLTAIKHTTLDAYHHQDVPFEKMVEAAGAARDLSRNPVFDVCFSLQNMEQYQQWGEGALAMTALPPESAGAVFDLDVEVTEADDCLQLIIQYGTALFRESTVECMFRQYKELLLSVLENRHREIGTLRLLGEEDITLFNTFNHTYQPLPSAYTADELIDVAADRYPERIAIQHGNSHIRFEQLRVKANGMAIQLQQELQLAPETLAGMLTDRSIDMIAAIYGCWKAGCGHIPLNPGLPPERLRVMIEDAQLEVLIYDPLHAALALQLQEICPTVRHLICTSVMDMPQTSVFRKTPVTHPDTLAYVIYTSGSTGRPKGAMLEHAGLINQLCAKISLFQLDEQSRIAQNASQSFDVSVWQMFVALFTGGTTFIYDEDLVLRTADFIQQVTTDGITVLEVVPSYLTVMLEETTRSHFDDLQYLMVAGETVRHQLVERWFDQFPDIMVVNAYGPAEASDDATFHFMDRVPDSKTVPIGKAVQNYCIYVVDQQGELCPVGVTGEIWISGLSVGRGYLNNPEKTAAAFCQDPFLQLPARLYKTGDLGRYQSDGTLEFLGRKDYQVKIRGHRIELGEVEQHLSKLKGVREVVVIDREDHEGQLALYGYVTLHADADTTPEVLKKALSAQLPGYMVPAHIMVMEQLPITVNGKIDRKILPYPDLDELATQEIVLPENRVEAEMVIIWQQLLELETVSVTADFFELGGHSLKGTQLISRIYKKFGVKLSVKEVFRQPTIRALSASILKETAADYEPIPKIAEQPYYDTSNAQQRLWIIDRIEEDLTAYNVYAAFHMQQPDMDAMAKAVNALTARHEALRTTFADVAGVPKQYIHPIGWQELELQVIDCRSHADTEAVLNEVKAAGGIPMDLATGPLFRTAIYLLSDNTCYLLLKMHHIICDGWSNNLLVKELLEGYQAFAADKPLLLPSLTIQYRDYAAWQLAKTDTPAFEAQRQYWLQQFAGDIPVLEFPTYRARPQMKTYNGATLEYKFSVTVKDQLYALGVQANASLFMTLAAVCNVLLFKYTGQKDIIIGTAAAGRDHPDLEGQVGYYLSTIALRNEVDPERSFLHLLETVKGNTLSAFDNQDYPFDTLVNELDLNRDMSRHPLFDVMLILQNLDEDAVTLMQEYSRELQIKPVTMTSHTAAFDMDIDFREEKDGLYLSLAYNTDLYDTEQMQRFVAHLEQLISTLHRNPLAAIGAAGIADETDVQQLQRFNDTDKVLDLDRTFYHYVEQFAAETPDKTAIIHRDKRVSYQQLNSSVNRMARVLQQQVGIERDDLLAVFMDRSDMMAATILSIWKCGGAYIPIEKKFPDNRVLSILEDAGVKAVIVEKNLVSPEMADRMRACCTVLFLDEVEAMAASMDDHNLSLPFYTGDLSFVMFTSGSTGRPKGAMNEHIGMMNHSLATVEYLSMNERTVLVQNASHGFDISVWQFFTAFITGGTTLVYDDEMVGMPEQFLQGLLDHRVTILQVVSSYLTVLLDLIEKDRERFALPLEFLICCGEILKPAVARRWLSMFPEKRMVNDYGPAEASDGTSWYIFDQVPPEMYSIPVGSSIYNMHTYIVDNNMNLCPAGVKGEICVSGIGVGRGYVNDPERTAKVFMPDPFSATPRRLYKTGDLGRYLPNGVLEFNGRKDYQVKVNGQRIELGEIEVKLAQLPPVKDAVVLDLNGPGDRKYLSAFVVLHQGDTTSITLLREMLSGELPVYMIPRTIQLLEALPLTHNGKIDRKLLSSMDQEIMTAPEAYEPPVTEMEKLLAAAWSQVLKRERVSITDNFYETGGDSISAIQLAAYVYKNGYKAEIRDIMKLPTIRELAPMLKPLRITAAQGTVTGPVPLTPIQAGFFAAGKTCPHHYNQAVMLQSAVRLEEAAVRTILEVLFQWHDALRITFNRKENRVEQYNEDTTLQPVLARYELPTAEQMESVAMELQAGFSLQHGPLLKAAIFSMPQADYLFVTAHHLIMDGVSWRIWIEDFTTLFEKQVQQQPLLLPPKTDSYQRWARQLITYATSPAFLQELPYWKAIAATPAGRIPYDINPAGSGLVKDLSSATITLDSTYTQKLVKEAQWAYNTNINDLLLSALGMATAQMFGIGSMMITLESHGREPLFDDISADRTIGWFTSEYPVYLDLSGVQELSRHIKLTKEYLHQVPNNGIGFGIADHITGTDIGKSIAPQLIFNYLGAMETTTEEARFELLEEAPGQQESGSNSSDYPLEIIGVLRDGCLSFTLHYHTTQFYPATITSWLQAYRKALEALTDHCLQQTVQEFTPSDYDYKDLSMDELEELKALLD